MRENLQPLNQKAKEYLEKESSGHDIYHARRVLKIAVYLHAGEGGDIDIIGPAALLHDICRPMEKKTGKSHFGPEALEIIRDILTEAKIEPDKIDPILKIVELHDNYDWGKQKQQKTLELQIVQDADNLDSMGAIGIARAFMFGGSYGLPMFEPAEGTSFDGSYDYDPSQLKGVVSHFYEKLLKLKDNMNTPTGKKLAEKRHQIMLDFLDHFFAEWEGKFE